MTRNVERRLDDIVSSIDAIRRYVDRGSLDDDLIFDAVRVRLLEMGEAIKGAPRDVLDQEPDIPWEQIAGMRDRLAHHYFDISRAIVRDTVENDLIELEAAVSRLRGTDTI